MSGRGKDVLIIDGQRAFAKDTGSFARGRRLGGTGGGGCCLFIVSNRLTLVFDVLGCSDILGGGGNI